MSTSNQRSPIDFDEFGFSAYTFAGPWCAGDDDAERRPNMPIHNHLEVELVLVEVGRVTLEFSGLCKDLTPLQPVLFWGGVPHRALYVDPGTTFHVAQVPLVEMLSWPNATFMLRSLLDGHLLHEPPDHQVAAVECLMFRRWSRDLQSTDLERRRAAELEIEARLRRFFTNTGLDLPAAKRSGTPPASRLTTVTRYITSHFREPITVKEIADAVGWHRDHLMSSFRRFCGITLWTYVTRMRLAEAQRLLSTTDLSVMEICHRSGFGSTSQMYAVFKKHWGLTPAQYRRGKHHTAANAARDTTSSTMLPPTPAKSGDRPVSQTGVDLNDSTRVMRY